MSIRSQLAPSKEEIDRDGLQAALNRLPDVFRLAVVMFYFEERSYREIAEELDLPIGTVMSRLARAKDQLRSMLCEPEQNMPEAAAKCSVQARIVRCEIEIDASLAAAFQDVPVPEGLAERLLDRLAADAAEGDSHRRSASRSM